ncbi:hypothetical protein H6F74_24640 [Trichocoleus sp. FACHB-90]|uniref:hypothetical protein n=1 Tax=Cyanophyceae TaxID=3028117 RepID=UPI0019B57FAC|nr:hypothetical protein [Trichocoleus sp. FACHB-90]MBD1929405.1 hypothetical protein [Trichocoleus sp. FACHB-90]
MNETAIAQVISNVENKRLERSLKIETGTISKHSVCHNLFTDLAKRLIPIV